MKPSLNVALKEWAIVCRAIEQGRQIVLLRKGGIYESAGEFEVEHPEFLLFPTYLHQNLTMLKPAEHVGFEPRSAEPETIEIRAAASITDIIQLKSRRQMDAIENEHVWTSPLIDMRFNYRPENPLYLLLVRAVRLAEPVKLENTPAFAGCKSWVPLGREIAVDIATESIDEKQFEIRRKSILAKLSTRE